MSVLTEVTHSVTPLTLEAFDAYVDIYCDLCIPGMLRHGYEILGGWKWSSGRLGNDLMLIRFESHAHREKAEASLLGDTALLERVRGQLAKAGVRVGEEIKFAEPLPHATRKRLEHALETSNSDRPRQYWLTRAPPGAGTGRVDTGLLNQLADQVESAGTHRLVIAHSTTVGIRGEVTHLWVSPLSDPHYRSGTDAPTASKKVREAIPEETVILLSPLPYSRLQ